MSAILIRLSLVVGMAMGLCGALAQNAGAQESAPAPHVRLAKTIGQPSQAGPIPSLAVINAQGAKLEGNTLTLTGVSPNSILFADRPVRAAGHINTSEMVAEWGPDGSFAKDPPNATVSVLGGTNATDAVITLRSARLDGNNLVFDVAVLEGNLTGASGPAALFIDRFGWGWRGRPWGWRGGGAWYAGGVAAGALLGAAAVGAATGPGYYPPYGYGPPPCGYYPYPPCY